MRTHGRASTYAHGCRCEPCSQANFRYQKRWKHEASLGLRRHIDSTEVRAHIGALLDAGWSAPGIAAAAGVGRAVVYKLADGQATVRRESAARILAVAVTSAPRRSDDDEVFVPATGTRRRIRALMAIGWRHADMQAHCGSPTSVIASQKGCWVTWRTRQRVAAMYDALSMTPGPSDAVRRRAARLGYAPPLAWDDDTIDDPAATPDHGTVPLLRDTVIDDVAVQQVLDEHRDVTTLAPAERREAIRRALAAGRGWNYCQDVLRASASTIRRALDEAAA